MAAVSSVPGNVWHLVEAQPSNISEMQAWGDK